MGGVKDSPRFPGEKVLSTEAGGNEANSNGNNDAESTRKGIKINQDGMCQHSPVCSAKLKAEFILQ